jgi:hypothetical protein
VPLSWPIDDLLKKREGSAPAGPLHEKYGLSKTREAEDMCNYSEYLIEQGIKKGIKTGRKEGIEEGKLDVLEQLEADHFGDKQIMKLLQINAEHLKSLRKMLQEKRAAVTAD